jgi:hypothetical protein
MSEETVALLPNAISIPEDNIAKLMYFLNAVHNCVDVAFDDRLINYRYYYDLSDEERREVVTFAHRYRPAALRNVIFYEVDDTSYMLTTTSNRFLELNDPVVIGSFNLPSNVVLVDGVQHVIRRVMIYKRVWAREFFMDPFEGEKWRIGLGPKPLAVVRTTTTRRPSHSGADVPYWLMGGVVCCLVLPPVGLALCCVACCKYMTEKSRRKRREQQPSVETTAYVVY